VKLVHRHARFVVFDDVLPTDALAQVGRYIRTEALLRNVHAGPSGYDRVWTFQDGQPLASAAVLLEVRRAKRRLRAGAPLPLNGPDRYAYPSDCAIDLLIDRLLRRFDAFGELVGEPNRDWRTLTARAFVYPPGASLDWHNDGGQVTGAYTYYANPEWRKEWGGELLIRTAETPDAGFFLEPRPNRLVVIRGNTDHKLCKVSLLAGNNWRASVSGFFDRMVVADEMD